MRLASVITLWVWLLGLAAPHVHTALHHETATACCFHAEEHKHESCLHRQTDSVFEHDCPSSVKAVIRLDRNRTLALDLRAPSATDLYAARGWQDRSFLTTLLARAPPV
ncbi:MAG: hypothetical protein HS115_18815 [Spirochaetales bacterium]|nr:hypothetical protein [Spirochaetales bacterium]